VLVSGFKRRLAAIIAALVVGTVGAVVVASPASAYTNCSPGRVCTYWDISYGGSMYYYTGPYWTCINVGYPWNDQISSVANTVSTMRVEFWTDANCGGIHTIANYGGRSGDGLADLRTYGMNDAISSLMFIS
jgi:peptidase inhibitor family I36